MSGRADLGEEALRRVRETWAALAGADAFPATGVTVVGNSASELCPRGWCGVVGIGAGVLATAPSEADAARLEPRLAGLDPLGDWSCAFRDAAESRGPAHLAYTDRVQPAGTPSPLPLEHRVAGDPAVIAFAERVPSADREEAHVEASTSPLVCVVDGRDVIAASGYRIWRGAVAHMAVLVDVTRRGQGLATAVARAATEHACAHGLVAQWRARPPTSRAVARILGYVDVGQQISVRLIEPPLSRTGRAARA